LVPNKVIPFAKITIPFIVGILLENYTQLTPSFLTIWLVGSFSSFTLLFILFKTSSIRRLLLSLSFYVFLCLTGLVVTSNQNRNEEDSSIEKSTYLKGHVSDVKKIKDSTITFEFIVKQYKQKKQWFNTINKTCILVHLKKNDTKFTIKANHKYVLKGYLIEISPPTTPSRIDYKSIYAKKNIFYKFYSSETQTLILPTELSYLDQYKIEFISFLKNNFNQKTFAFISALVANQKEYFSDDLKNKITQNGISHLIAISGLHIGIIYFLLNFLVHLVPKNRKTYHVISSVIICLILILYGTFCGFTPSISRSVTMFCVMQLAKLTGRKNNSINSLFVSAFLILIIQPSQLFQIGFQLSFAGVLAILLFYKQINNWFTIVNKLLKKIWQSVAVTISAQIGVLPMLFFYFKTFSINGIFLSLILTLLIAALVGFSVVLLLFFKIAVINSLLVFMIKNLSIPFFWVLNLSSQFQVAVFYNNMTVSMVVLFYSIIYFLFRYLKNKTRLIIKPILVSVIIFLIIQLVQRVSAEKTLFIYSNKELTLEYCGQVYTPHSKIKNKLFPSTNFYGNKIIVLDKKVFLFQQNKITATLPKLDFLILSTEVNYKKILATNPSIVIFDNDLSNFYIKNLIPHLLRNKIIFHRLKKDGYFSLP